MVVAVKESLPADAADASPRASGKARSRESRAPDAAQTGSGAGQTWHAPPFAPIAASLAPPRSATDAPRPAESHRTSQQVRLVCCLGHAPVRTAACARNSRRPLHGAELRGVRTPPSAWSSASSSPAHFSCVWTLRAPRGEIGSSCRRRSTPPRARTAPPGTSPTRWAVDRDWWTTRGRRAHRS
eukprot:scaffold1954_cov268-Pinguiococcus_pyrenoidosus.AAC.254